MINKHTQSTNKVILDYLLYLSIQSRLKQARVELLELSTPLPGVKDDGVIFESRRKRWEETALKAEQDKNAVESIVAGILSSHRNRTFSFNLDHNFEQRLHLCQLTNLIFGRFDASSTSQHAIAHSASSERRRKRHETQVYEGIIDDEDCDLKRRQLMFSQKPITPPFCRRHRIQNCHGCHYRIHQNVESIQMKSFHRLEEEDIGDDTQSESVVEEHHVIPPAGLIEAIPTFLRTSADLLRRTLDKQNDDGNPMTFAGQKVMGGGMLPQWYDLFLELLTQAAIESYLCDSQTGLESIFEIFSYGDVEDEEHEEEEEEEEEHDSNDEIQEEHVDEWGIRPQDHHLLFPKTRTMHLFKTQVREREKDFLEVERGKSLQQHFEKLAQTFPLQTFEKNMGEFIQMILDSMDTPTLDKYEKNISAEDSELAVYKYPSDGSLLMPEIPDEEDKIPGKRSHEIDTSDERKKRKEDEE